MSIGSRLKKLETLTGGNFGLCHCAPRHTGVQVMGRVIDTSPRTGAAAQMKPAKTGGMFDPHCPWCGGLGRVIVIRGNGLTLDGRQVKALGDGISMDDI